MTRVSVGARLHFGFQNLSLAHRRLYGGIGAALAEPRLVLRAERHDTVSCDDPAAMPYVEAVAEYLEVPGARVVVEDSIQRHAGLGSGTRLALSCLVAVAGAYDRDVTPRTAAPALGRGGRSGIGVATFERGGFIVEGGHPAELFTSAPPERGEWSVPPVVASHDLPETWRFVLVVPDGAAGPSGMTEEASIRSVVESADPGIADEIARLLTQQLLPAAATSDRSTFGRAVARLGRLNGAWYADEQGGVYRPPAGVFIDRLSDEPVVAGTGQSSWGPTAYAVTTAEHADSVAGVASDALQDAGTDGQVVVTRPQNEGARVGRTP
jgi:beta-ribofuranosylaminobenzene 5'-phosphate synthase